MIKICIFAGTTEGRDLVDFLNDTQADVSVCVASDYGKIALGATKAHVFTKRMDCAEMQKFFAEHAFDLLLDATHPYATIVTENIVKASSAMNIEYIRITRQSMAKNYFETVESAIDYINTTTGSILLTTGSKDLATYSTIKDYKKRIYARVLPITSSLELCEAQGYEPSHVIAVQGPFSEELNSAMLQEYDIKILVTKDSGLNGGFEEKLSACKAQNVECIVIGRPSEEVGSSYLQAIEVLREKLGIQTKQRIHIIGLGAGSAKTMTVQAVDVLKKCHIIIGAKRLTDSCAHFHKPIFNSFLAKDVIHIAETNTEYTDIAVVLSGDIGFYSGAKKMHDALFDYEVTTVCGISSLVYFCSKLALSWDDIQLVSLHGKEDNLLDAVKTNEKVFCLVGGKDGVQSLCKTLCDYGFYAAKLYVGENLSYDDEKISIGTAKEFAQIEFSPLSTVIIENAEFSTKQRIGIDDDEFIRIEKIPMTKSEVRAVAIAKLQLEKNSIVYDIGAGTGSVSIECALASPKGTVYAIEKNEIAVNAIQQNKMKFAVQNLEIIAGNAPDALVDLEMPTHAFIGGSSGNIKEIMELLLAKNPNVTIVVTVIALETLTQTLSAIESLRIKNNDIVHMTVAKSKKLGNYNMMMGQNPIYVIRCQN